MDNTTFDAWADFGEDEFLLSPLKSPGSVWEPCGSFLRSVLSGWVECLTICCTNVDAKANCFASQPAKGHSASCLCTSRFVQKLRVSPPRLAVRRQVCLRRIRRLNAWVEEKDIRLKSVQRLRAHICRHLQMQKSLRGPNIHVSGHLQCGQNQPTSGTSGLGMAHPPQESHRYPNTSGRRPLFRAGAGGSAAHPPPKTRKVISPWPPATFANGFG